MTRETENINLRSAEEVLIYVKKQLTALRLVPVEYLYRQLEVQCPGHPVIRQVKQTIAEFLQFRFAEFLQDGQQISDHYHAYMHGIAKKTDITRNIPGFSEIARRIIAEENTLLYYDRLYTIFQAVENTRRLKGDIIELGVYRGGSLKFIAEVCDHLQLSPRIYGFDTFCGHAGVTDDDFTQSETHFTATSLAEVGDYVARCRSVTLVPGDARTTLEPLLSQIQSLAFVHLDLDLFDPTQQALRLLAPKLASGGIIVVDDYGFISCAGVRKATDEFVLQSGFQRIHLMTGQCLLLKA